MASRTSKRRSVELDIDAMRPPLRGSVCGEKATRSVRYGEPDLRELP